ncbi:MAG: alkyl/aryl-sulfatase, partial [Candidatus Hydrogenedentales bacterium]
MRRFFVVIAACSALNSAAQSPAEKLAAHTDEFRKEIIQVTDGVHVAVGYALANSILIEGNDAVIVVDVTESAAAAEEIKAEFDKITDKPVAAIIYTHNHTDHIMGAKVFAGDDKPEVYAQTDLHDNVRHIYEEVTPAIFARSVRQFGVPLPPDVFLNCGIGPRLRAGTGGLATYLEPTQSFDDRLETEIAGVRVVLQHAPGETDDQLYVWLPDKKTLLPGDNFYKSFPNLYAIRGTRYRDVREWANSLDKMIAEGEIEHLVPSHTRPISGAAKIRETLSNYRDAIRHVYAETIKGINAGVDPVALS